MKNPKYNLKFDKPDERDFQWQLPISKFTIDDLPSSVDLSPSFPSVYDQGRINSCASNAVAGIHHYRQLLADSLTAFQPSRLFLYYNARKSSGNIANDPGVSLREVLNPAEEYGVCSEKSWPYDPDLYIQMPDGSCYEEALHHRIMYYYSVSQDLNKLRYALASGNPFIFGFMVYSQYDSIFCELKGIVKTPGWWSRNILGSIGGHSVIAVGYDDERKQFKFRNSMGNGWGEKGYGWIGYDYVLDRRLAADFWIIKTVENS